MPASFSPVRLRRAVALGSVGTLCALAAATVPAHAAPPTTPFLAEVHYDNSGTDAGEFVEVQVPGGTSTAGWTVVLYNGSNGASYDSDALPAVSPPAGGPAAVAVVDYPVNGIQNGSPDGIALVNASGAVVEFFSYEGPMTASNGPAAGRTSIDIGVAETGSEPAGLSLSRRYSTVADNVVWQAPAANTRGIANPPLNDAPPPPPPAPCTTTPTHEIGAVQGTGAASPLVDQQVVVRGVVVGDVPGLRGFYLQDSDGNADTSDGVFVFSSVAVALGDDVQVSGKVQEFALQTQVSPGTNVELCGVAALPAATPLDLPADDAARERLEGMLVTATDILTVSEVFALTSFGELTLSEGGLLVQPTELARPGAGAQAIAANNLLRSIVLDDALTSRTSITTRPYLSPATPVRVGDELSFTEPLVLGFGFGQWRLQPADGTADGVFAAQNSRPATPDAVGGDVTIGSFNVLNYFLTFTGPDARGARNAAGLEKQAAKIVSAITALDADVLSLQEVEDTASTGYGDGSPDQALADLVRRLNLEAGGAVWAFTPFPAELLAVDRDVIRNAIIYKQDVVQPVGPSVGLVDEAIWYNAREPIAQTFAKDGDVFTVVANHFKSKSPGAPTGDNIDTGDGQGQWNGDRVRQAVSLAAFTDRLGASTGDDDVLVLGDLNSYTQEDPIEVLRAAGFTDLGSLLDEGRYSYVFGARSGSLDHAMATASLSAKVTDAAHWNINAVESFAYQYTGDPALYAPHQYRASDHDPLILGIDLEERCFGLLPTITGTNGDDVITGTNESDVIMGLGGNDAIDGGNGDDVICGGRGDDSVRGNNGNDRLNGGFGADVVDGGNGNDVLVGGPGVDALAGGRGVNSSQQEGRES